MIQVLDQERGFTLLEVLMSVVMLIIVATAVWSAFAAGLHFNAESEDKTVASNIAQAKMEAVISTLFTDVVTIHPAGETSFTSQLQGEPYWVQNSGGQWNLALPEGRYTIEYPNGETSDPLVAKVTVLWTNQLGVACSLSLESQISITPGR